MRRTTAYLVTKANVFLRLLAASEWIEHPWMRKAKVVRSLGKGKGQEVMNVKEEEEDDEEEDEDDNDEDLYDGHEELVGIGELMQLMLSIRNEMR